MSFIKATLLSTCLARASSRALIASKLVNNTINYAFLSSHLTKPIASFDEVKCAKNNCSVLLIDVREPAELQETGVLPGSINIPLGEVETTLKNMSDTEFQKKFGRKKPDPKTPIIFSCMRGIRSEKAQDAAIKLGYKETKNYLGGWVDWVERNKQ